VPADEQRNGGLWLCRRQVLELRCRNRPPKPAFARLGQSKAMDPAGFRERQGPKKEATRCFLYQRACRDCFPVTLARPEVEDKYEILSGGRKSCTACYKHSPRSYPCASFASIPQTHLEPPDSQRLAAQAAEAFATLVYR